MTAYILAGGLGTRLQQLNIDVPKPMVKIDGIPCLQRQIECLKAQGVTDFVLILNHQSDVIMNYFGDGQKLGVKINYFVEDYPLGTAGALFQMNINEDFLFLNGDLVFDFSLEHMQSFHKQNNALITCFAHGSTHPQDSTLIDCDKTGLIRKFILKGEINPDECTLTNAGIFIVSPELLKMFCFGGASADFDRDVLRPLAGKGKIYAYNSFEYVSDMGTPDRLEKVNRNVQNGIVTGFSKANWQKAVFLDRDGTLNKHTGYVHSPDEIQLIDGVPDALKKIKEKGYLLIIVTNQPTVARGENTIEEIEQINNHLKYLLSLKGAVIDGIYFCPHHPHKGYEGEREEYKINCDCRKPKPGMLIKASEDFNINLKQSYMVGDSEADIQAGENAGCKTALISDSYSLIDFANEI